MKTQSKHFFGLNIALVLIATAAPLGNFIQLPPEISIWTRCAIAFLCIGLFNIVTKVGFAYNYQKDSLGFIIAALLQGIHWVTYFYALQLAGAGLGIIALFTYPIFTALLEPVILKTKFNPIHIALGGLVLLGLYILTPEFNFANTTTTGIGFGIVSAVVYATRNIMMKKYVSVYNSSMLMFYQVGLVSLLFAPVLFIIDFDFSSYQAQFPYLLFLGVITTALGHTLLVKSFKNFSATTASLLSCMQPLYGMILAYLFIREKQSLTTLIGGAFIISAVVLESLLNKKQSA